MLNKYYNNCQKHVEKCSESYGDLKNISYFIYWARLIFDFLLGELVCQFLPFMSETNSGQLINNP